jgi:hypothetical protein
VIKIDDSLPSSCGVHWEKEVVCLRRKIGLSKVDIVSKSSRRMFGSPASAFKFEFITSELIVGEICHRTKKASKKHDLINTRILEKICIEAI